MKMTKKQLMAGIIGVVAVNAIIIIGIMVFIGNKASSDPNSKEEWMVNSPEVTAEEMNVENTDKEKFPVEEVVTEEDSGLFKKEEPKLSEEENYQVIYMALIPGTYETEDGQIFTFNTDGTFEGYYNAENTSVSRYNYGIEGEIGVDSCIKISTPTFSESVTYPLEFTEDGKILMYYTGDKFIELGV